VTKRRGLRQTKEWEPYLTAESRLPGPRANLELAHARNAEQLALLRASPHEFCGAGANDARWRVREAVAIAVQRIGGPAAVEHMRDWARGTRREQRAAAALCERWIVDGDAGTRRIMRENLRKARLARLDGEWVERQLARI
jgi:hypothetical protein